MAIPGSNGDCCLYSRGRNALHARAARATVLENEKAQSVFRRRLSFYIVRLSCRKRRMKQESRLITLRKNLKAKLLESLETGVPLADGSGDFLFGCICCVINNLSAATNTYARVNMKTFTAIAALALAAASSPQDASVLRTRGWKHVGRAPSHVKKR